MIRSDVGDDRDVWTEIIAVVQLETADLQNIVVEVFCGDLVGVALADVAAESHVESCVLKQVVDQGCRGGLAVASGDADLLRRVVAAGELDLGDDVDSLRLDLLDDRGGAWNAGTLDHLIGVQDKFLSVMTFLEADVPFAEFVRKVVGNLSVVGKEDIESFHLSENSGSDSALSASQNYNSAHILKFILSSTMPMW